MKVSYISHPAKCLFALLTGIVLLALGVLQIGAGNWIVGVGSLLLMAVFLLVAAIYGSTIHMDEEGVSSTLLNIPLRRYSWDQIQEVGVVGTKVFNNADLSEEDQEGDVSGKKGFAAKHPKTGAVYIYFSTSPLTKQERFALALKWPPLDKIFLHYTEDRIDQVQVRYGLYIERYNVGDLRI